MTDVFQATVGEPWICPVLGWSLSPTGEGPSHLTSASQVHLQWAQCPGNVVKQRVIFAEAHDSTVLGSVLGPRVGAGGHTAPSRSPPIGTRFKILSQVTDTWAACVPVARKSLRLGDRR